MHLHRITLLWQVKKVGIIWICEFYFESEIPVAKNKEQEWGRGDFVKMQEKYAQHARRKKKISASECAIILVLVSVHTGV